MYNNPLIAALSPLNLKPIWSPRLMLISALKAHLSSPTDEADKDLNPYNNLLSSVQRNILKSHNPRNPKPTKITKELP